MNADTLPPLPEPAREAEEACASWRNASPDYFTAAQMREYALAAALAERERCAKVVLDGAYWNGGPAAAYECAKDRAAAILRSD
jgi:hypothetical protein